MVVNGWTKYSPAGYAWIFPLGNNIARIGVGIGKPDSPCRPNCKD